MMQSVIKELWIVALSNSHCYEADFNNNNIENEVSLSYYGPFLILFVWLHCLAF